VSLHYGNLSGKICEQAVVAGAHTNTKSKSSDKLARRSRLSFSRSLFWYIHNLNDDKATLNHAVMDVANDEPHQGRQS